MKPPMSAEKIIGIVRKEMTSKQGQADGQVTVTLPGINEEFLRYALGKSTILFGAIKQESKHTFTIAF